MFSTSGSKTRNVAHFRAWTLPCPHGRGWVRNMKLFLKALPKNADWNGRIEMALDAEAVKCFVNLKDVFRSK